MTNILDKDQITIFKKSGAILKDALFEVKKNLRAGVSAYELDLIAEKYIKQRGGVPSFKNYKVLGSGYYPASLCVSINNEVVHGLPLKNKIIKEGDVVSLDLGVNYKGICSDMADTIYIGKNCPDEISNLIITAKKCLEMAISSIITGGHIGIIGHTVQFIAEKNGYGVIRDLVGHGIGSKPHMDPAIPNYGSESDGPIISEGMALAIEPMITLGDYQVDTAQDGWTIVTSDGSISAHCEHSLVIIDGKPVIVTK